MSTTLLSIKDKAFAAPKAVWGFVALVCAGVAFLLWKFLFAPASSIREPQVADDDTARPPTEEEKQLWLAERRAEEKMGMKESANALKNRIAEIQGQLRQNYEEAVQNQTKFKAMFSANKTSYDDDLTGFEDEQDLNTSFMLKDDLEGKKQGMIKLGQELGKQKDYLMRDRTGVVQTLARLNEEWVQMFPGDDPLFVPPQTQPVAPPAPEVPREQEAAQKAFYDRKNTMMPDGMLDGTGREAIPL